MSMWFQHGYFVIIIQVNIYDLSISVHIFLAPGQLNLMLRYCILFIEKIDAMKKTNTNYFKKERRKHYTDILTMSLPFPSPDDEAVSILYFCNWMVPCIETGWKAF